MSRRFVAWAVAAAFLGVALGCNNDKSGEPSGSSRAPAAEVKLAAVKLDGLEKAITDAKGKVVLIDFWATWCPPCVKSFPKLVEKHHRYFDKGLAVISVSLDDHDEAEAVLTFLQQNGAEFTNLHLERDAAAAQGLQEKFGYRSSIPHAVLFDRTGKRVWTGHPLDDNLHVRLELELAKQ